MVQKKYIETHKKTRRVGRHRYVSDGVRKEYYLQVAFENGNVETLHVSPSTYNKTKTGRPKILTLQKGLFGLPVITKDFNESHTTFRMGYISFKSDILLFFLFFILLIFAFSLQMGRVRLI